MSSNPDTFIDEVTEAVRHDRLFAAFRRYGWIGVLLILAIVGFTAWSEWSRHRAEIRAEAFGDALTAALAEKDPATRLAALDAVKPADADQAAVLALLAGTTPDTADRLAKVADDTSLPPVYRDLAAFRRLLLSPDMPEADRVKGFEALTTPGAPFRLLAEEQLALIDVAAGRTEAALKKLDALSQDSEASGALRTRASQLIVALGGKPAQQAGN